MRAPRPTPVQAARALGGGLIGEDFRLEDGLGSRDKTEVIRVYLHASVCACLVMKVSDGRRFPSCPSSFCLPDSMQTTFLRTLLAFAGR